MALVALRCKFHTRQLLAASMSARGNPKHAIPVLDMDLANANLLFSVKVTTEGKQVFMHLNPGWNAYLKCFTVLVRAHQCCLMCDRKEDIGSAGLIAGLIACLL